MRVGYIDSGRAGLRAARERTAPFSELVFPGAASDFQMCTTSVSLAAMVLVEARAPQLRYNRSVRHVAAGDDRYMFTVYLHGEAHMRIAGDEIAMSAGSIAVIDLACPSQTEVAPSRDERFAHHVTLLVPRVQLAPLLAAPDAVGGQVIRGGAGYGRMVHGLLLELWRQAADLDAAQSARATAALVGLVAGALRPAPGRELDVARAELAARRAAIKRYLDQQTEPVDVDVGALCRRFGMSRASLYRLFEADGGLVHYVRQQRLQQARDLLSSPAQHHRRIIDIAFQHGFHSECGFIRAFRRRFGVTPGEVRAAAAAHRGAGPFVT